MLSLRNIAFALLMLLYLGYPLSMIQGVEQISIEGHSYRIRPIPVDPFDAFRGAYLTLSYNTRIDYPQANEAFKKDQTVYVEMDRDSLGYHYFASVQANPPSHSAYFKTQINRVDSNRVSIKTPDNITRYFLPEKWAKKAEKAYWDRNRRGTDANDVYIDVKVLDGEIMIDELYMDGWPILDFLNQLPEEEGN